MCMPSTWDRKRRLQVKAKNVRRVSTIHPSFEESLATPCFGMNHFFYFGAFGTIA
jgi:hypothetical protein